MNRGNYVNFLNSYSISNSDNGGPIPRSFDNLNYSGIIFINSEKLFTLDAKSSSFSSARVVGK